LFSIINLSPAPSGAASTDISDDGLPAGMNMHVLDPDLLLASATQTRQRFHLGRVGSKELYGQPTAALQSDDALRLLRAGEHFHCDFIGADHLDSEHRLNLVLRVDAVQGSEGCVERFFRRHLLASPTHNSCQPSAADRGECTRGGPECIQPPDRV
jgi:hypothetical protein